MSNNIFNKEKKVYYEVHEKLGEGMYGEVYRGVNCTTKEVVAIKRMKFMKTSVRLRSLRIGLWRRKKSS